MGAPRSQPLPEPLPMANLELPPLAAPHVPAPGPEPRYPDADVGPFPLPRPAQTTPTEPSYLGRRLQQADHASPLPEPVFAAAPSLGVASPASGPSAAPMGDDFETAAAPLADITSGPVAAPSYEFATLAAAPAVMSASGPAFAEGPASNLFSSDVGNQAAVPAAGPALPPTLPAAGPVVGPHPLEPFAAAPVPNPAMQASLPQPMLPLEAAGPVGDLLAPAPSISGAVFPAFGPSVAWAPAPLPNRLPELPEVQVLGLPALPEINLPSDPSELLPFRVGYGPNPAPRVAPVSITMGRKLKASGRS